MKLAASSYYAAIVLSRALLYSFYSCSNICSPMVGHLCSLVRSLVTCFAVAFSGFDHGDGTQEIAIRRKLAASSEDEACVVFAEQLDLAAAVF